MKTSIYNLLKLFVIPLFFLSHISLSGQKLKADDIPEDVRQTLEFEHPAAKVSSWIAENDMFIATFKEDGSNAKAYIRNDAQWIKTTYPVPRGELPSAITDYIKKNYPTYTYASTQLQTTPNEKMHYYIEIKPEGVASGEGSTLTFNDVGQLMVRKDPAGFVDPTKAPEKPVQETAQKAGTGTAKKPAATTTKAPAKAPEPKKNAQKPEPKPVATKPAPEPKAPKEEKAKKEKPVKPVFDEFGNEALPASQIPAAVTKELTKKIQRPEELNWFKIDTFYVAKCKYRDQKNEVFITPAGKWEKTYIHIPKESVTGNMAKHLDSFYRGWRFNKAVKELRADKQDKTMVEIYEKDNWKDKLVTTVIFDKTGKLIRSIDPNYTIEGQEEDFDTDGDLEKYYEKMSMGMGDANQGIPTEIVNAFKSKNPKVNNPEWSRDDDGNYLASYMGARGKEISVIGQSGTLLQTQNQGRPELIPESIQNYIKQNHKGFKVDDYFAVRDILEKKNYYKVDISNKKTKEQETLWFTTAGKIVD